MSHNPQDSQVPAGVVLLPAPTAWPLVLAFGCALGFAGLVTSYNITLLGVVFAIAGIVGWARQVFPVEQHEEVAVVPHQMDLQIDRRRVARIHIDESHRSLFPQQTYTVSSGILGGFAGGTAMIVLAELYGVVIHHSLWYPINLLGGAGVAGWLNPTDAELNSFRLSAVVIAIIVHTCTSFLVGLLHFCQFFRGIPSFWADLSVPRYGRACFTRHSHSSIRSSILTSTGGGSRFRRSVLDSSLESWSSSMDT